MTGRRFLLAIVLLFLTSSHLFAQAIVNIRLESGTPRTIVVTPNVTVVCRNTPGCPTGLNFRWVGTPGSDSTERIWVEYKNGLYWNGSTPAQNDATDCFLFPADNNPFDLQHGAANGRNIIFRAGNTACKDKVAFFYEIRCQNEAENNCGGVGIAPFHWNLDFVFHAFYHGIVGFVPVWRRVGVAE